MNFSRPNLQVEAETQDQYQRYINEKRREEKNWQEFRQYQMSLESQLRRRQLIDCIKHKEQRSANLRAYIDDQKVSFQLKRILNSYWSGFILLRPRIQRFLTLTKYFLSYSMQELGMQVLPSGYGHGATT